MLHFFADEILISIVKYQILSMCRRKIVEIYSAFSGANVEAAADIGSDLRFFDHCGTPVALSPHRHIIFHVNGVRKGPGTIISNSLKQRQVRKDALPAKRSRIIKP